MKYLVKILKAAVILVILTVVGIVFLFGHRDIPLNELKSQYTNSASSFISIGGMDVHYRDEGDPSDSIPIVLIHGTASSLHTFDAWTDSLKNLRRVVRMDLPAYGLTGPFPDCNYSMSNYTAFIKKFLIAKGIDQCVLAGNSLGGQIAWNFALVEPGYVYKLILIDAAGYPSNSKSTPIAFTVAQTPILSNLLTFITPRFVVKASIENVFYNKSKVTDALVDRYFDLTLGEGNRQAFVDRFKVTDDKKAYKDISRIKQPTLILWGAKDLLIPVDIAYQFQKDLPNGTLVILDDTGHTPMEESPVESMEAVMGFLQI